jgi:hypothetical protein
MAEPEGGTLEGVPTQYVCDVCGATFDKPQGLGAHRARSHGYRRGDDQVSNVQPQFGPEDVFTHEEGLLDMMEEAINSVLFRDRASEFLPYLAKEAASRRAAGEDASELVDAFFTLYLDAS